MDLEFDPKNDKQSYRVSGRWTEQDWLAKGGVEVNNRGVVLSLASTYRAHPSTVLGFMGGFDVLNKTWTQYDAGLVYSPTPEIDCMLGHVSNGEKTLKPCDFVFKSFMYLHNHFHLGTESVFHYDTKHISNTVGIRACFGNALTAKAKVSISICILSVDR